MKITKSVRYSFYIFIFYIVMTALAERFFGVGYVGVIGKHKCSKNGKFECSVFGNDRAAVLSFKSTGCQ